MRVVRLPPSSSPLLDGSPMAVDGIAEGVIDGGDDGGGDGEAVGETDGDKVGSEVVGEIVVGRTVGGGTGGRVEVSVSIHRALSVIVVVMAQMPSEVHPDPHGSSKKVSLLSSSERRTCAKVR